MQDELHTARHKQHVSWSQLVAYSAGGIIPIALVNTAGTLMGLLGNISLGLSAFWLGFIMLIPRLWDAFSDPLIGYVSDNTRTRWGCRRPYVLIGGFTVALSFVAMWWVPKSESVMALFPSESSSNWFQLVFILAVLVVFFTTTTVFEIPHAALGLEMSPDQHQRTRLFSAKSFTGNLFAMATPWLFYLAGLEFFKGLGGDQIDGMRYVSMLVAAIVIGMTLWSIVTLTEPPRIVGKEGKRSAFWSDLGIILSNKTLLCLVAIVFILAMGFNFVGLFNFYITIFYLYGGDTIKAAPLVGISGTVWGVSALVAVFPLNWLSERFGKHHTLRIAVIVMCVAQLSKCVCYDPEHPYLILIPTVLLSAGMLMFFTLGSSMVGDLCDEEDLMTGSRRQGSYYAVFWWFMKVGGALASVGTGALLVLTGPLQSFRSIPIEP